MLKKIEIIVIALLAIILAVSVSTLFIDYADLKKVMTQNVTNTTVVLVQEEQEYSVKEIVAKEPDAEVFIPEKYRALVVSLCKQNDVPLYVFAKLIQSESRWNPKAHRTNYVYNKDGTPVKNKDGTRKIHSYDRGIAQLNTLNYPEFSWRFNDNQEVIPWDTTMSLTIACRYLSWLYDRTHSWYDSCCAYKCGLTNVRIENIPSIVEEISKAIIDPKISALDVQYFP